MAPNRVPLEVGQAAEAQQLGVFLRVYKTTITWTILGSLNFTLLGALGWFLLASYIGDPEDGVGLLIFALLLLGMAINKLSQVIQRTIQRIYLFKQGIVITTINQVQVLPWNQVTEIWGSVTRERIFTEFPYFARTISFYTLRRRDGYQIKLNNSTKDITLLGHAALQGITQELIPQALDAIQTGQTLTFSPFSLNQQGISKGGEYLPWSQVQAVVVEVGHVVVKKVEKSQYWGEHLIWERADVEKIPNYLVFTRVVEELMQQAGGRR